MALQERQWGQGGAAAARCVTQGAKAPFAVSIDPETGSLMAGLPFRIIMIM